MTGNMIEGPIFWLKFWFTQWNMQYMMQGKPREIELNLRHDTTYRKKHDMT